MISIYLIELGSPENIQHSRYPSVLTDNVQFQNVFGPIHTKESAEDLETKRQSC